MTFVDLSDSYHEGVNICIYLHAFNDFVRMMILSRLWRHGSPRLTDLRESSVFPGRYPLQYYTSIVLYSAIYTCYYLVPDELLGIWVCQWTNPRGYTSVYDHNNAAAVLSILWNLTLRSSATEEYWVNDYLIMFVVYVNMWEAALLSRALPMQVDWQN